MSGLPESVYLALGALAMARAVQRLWLPHLPWEFLPLLWGLHRHLPGSPPLAHILATSPAFPPISNATSPPEALP